MGYMNSLIQSPLTSLIKTILWILILSRFGQGLVLRCVYNFFQGIKNRNKWSGQELDPGHQGTSQEIKGEGIR